MNRRVGRRGTSSRPRCQISSVSVSGLASVGVSEPQAIERAVRAKRTRAGLPQRLKRRVAERCDAPRRFAFPTVMSISPTRLIDDPTAVCGRFCVKRCGPSRRRIAPAVPKKFVRQSKRPFSTLSALFGLGNCVSRCPLIGAKQTLHSNRPGAGERSAPDNRAYHV